MQIYSTSILEILRTLRRNKSLILASVKREVLSRYRGSFIGVFWSFFNPLFMLVVYTFVFSVVFQAKWGGGGNSKTEFALVLFSGMIVFNIFSECINRAPQCIVANPNYVKKVIYPLEILPIIDLFTSMFHGLISIVVWVIAYSILIGFPQKSIILLPIVLFPFLLATLGLSWLLASLGVYLRDINQFIGIFTSVLMFVSPIFYPVSALPEAYRSILYANPLTIIVEQVRDVMYWGICPSVVTIGICYVFGVLIAWAGFVWFQKTRKGFADVL